LASNGLLASRGDVRLKMGSTTPGGRIAEAGICTVFCVTLRPCACAFKTAFLSSASLGFAVVGAAVTVPLRARRAGMTARTRILSPGAAELGSPSECEG
jgi:hypothetical protein